MLLPWHVGQPFLVWEKTCDYIIDHMVSLSVKVDSNIFTELRLLYDLCFVNILYNFLLFLIACHEIKCLC